MAAKKPFRFQQFTVRDDRAAMKVGTDGVLLGAWAPIRDAKQILDVGTGSGLIALMLAQRSRANASEVSAIDIDQGASEQAIENFQASPWPDRLPGSLDLTHCSLKEFAFVCTVTNSSFDLVVSNPPYFAADNKQPAPRLTARQTDDFSRRSFFQNVVSLLSVAGRICLILPFDQAEITIEVAKEFDLHLMSRTNVRANVAATELKRVLLEFTSTSNHSTSESELVIEKSRHEFTEQYAALTQDFHLRYGAQ